jgi:putative transposase
VPTRLKRYYGAQDLHFITCSCYHRLPILGSARRRDWFLQVLEETRQQYQFVVYGYVVMPEHFHLLISEPEKANPSVLMKVLKQRFACDYARSVVDRGHKCGFGPMAGTKESGRSVSMISMSGATASGLRNCAISTAILKRGLVSEPDQWRWSSFRSYAYGERGPVRVNFQEWKLTIKSQVRETFT